MLNLDGEGVLVALAARFGDVRLIDNIQVTATDASGRMEETELEIDGGN